MPKIGKIGAIDVTFLLEDLVNISAMFVEEASYALLTIPVAAGSLTLWYAIAKCHFFNVNSG
jgi:hypothetical protein